MYTDRLCPGCMNDSGDERICNVCGFDKSLQNANFCLPIRFLLSERYVIGKAISLNSEGITYIAWDNASDTAVHIKEYFPKDMSVRNPDKTVAVVKGNEFYFNEGLLNFIEINRKLIATELQSIVPVLTVFEENGTVYAVMPIVSSITLQSFLERNGGSLRWEQVRPLFLPLIDTLGGLHELGIIHGGISPETIIVGRDGKLRFNGICISRLRSVSSDSPAELYNGYSAAEQYGKTDSNLCEASDVYALSAVLFRTIIGTVPPSAEARLTQDTLSIPARFADELPRQVLVAIANGMQLYTQNRTPSIDVFKNELVYGETQENLRRAANTHVAEQKVKQAEAKPQNTGNNGVKYGLIAAGITVGVFLIIGILAVIILKPFSNDDPVINNSEVVSIPDMPQLGDVDPGAENSVILYEVPDLTGKFYYQLEDDEYERFKFTIKGKEYSDKFERGMICAQSVAKGTPVENETEIQVTISLGPKEIKVANVVGLDEMSAKLELLKQGFLYDNIEVVEKYDSEAEPGIVLEQDPAFGDSVTAESVIRIYVNSYKGDDNSDDSNNSSDYFN